MPKKKPTPPPFSYHAEWRAPDGGGTSGVGDGPGGLVWWHAPGGDGGRFGEVACDQTIADFLANGPRVSGTPAAEADKLRAALAAAGYKA